MHLPTPRHRRKISLSFTQSEGRTEQAHADDCEIHRIMEKYNKTGLITHQKAYAGSYMNMAEAPDFAAAQQMIAAANQMFETVPATIRAKFQNRPEKFVEFMQDEANREEMASLGLPTDHLPAKEPDPPPTPTPPAETPPAAA